MATVPVPRWSAVVAVMVGIFAIVTTEILPVGLLTGIGGSFDVSDGRAGLMMAVPGVLAACAAPGVTVLTGRLDRRVMLCAFMALLAAANLIAACATSFPVMLASRVMVGVVIGGFWSIAAGVAARLVPERERARATAFVFAGVPLGSVLGVPLGTLLGDLAGWRTAFAVMGVVSVLVCAALAATVPRLPAGTATRAAVLLRTLRARPTRAALTVTFLVVLAHFGTYTYVTPFLEGVTGVGAGTVTALLLLYGAAGVAGNFAGGAAVARWPRAAFGIAAAGIGGVALLLPLVGRGLVGAAVLLLLWGAAYGAVPVCSQNWFSRGAGGAPEAAGVLFTAAFQATFALGAFAGGLVLDRTSLTTVLVCGGGVACLAAASVRAVGRVSP
ncbi:MFS transporter [Streptomyces sp. NPDC048172]|uniref:MFS transporter n=1 Tax=Streptomyces sp. NPDC048172 TaxID=3365505 RepID=UPI00371A02A4